jgi:hypothetical protein
MTAMARFMAILGLLLVAILALAMSLCGGGFTVMALFAVLDGRINMASAAFVFFFPLPCLLLGVFVLVHVWRLLNKLKEGQEER